MPQTKKKVKESFRSNEFTRLRDKLGGTRVIGMWINLACNVQRVCLTKVTMTILPLQLCPILSIRYCPKWIVYVKREAPSGPQLICSIMWTIIIDDQTNEPGRPLTNLQTNRMSAIWMQLRICALLLTTHSTQMSNYIRPSNHIVHHEPQKHLLLTHLSTVMDNTNIHICSCVMVEFAMLSTI